MIVEIYKKFLISIVRVTNLLVIQATFDQNLTLCMMPLLYQIAIRAYVLLIQLIAPFHPKANKWVEGHKGWRTSLKAAMQSKGDKHVIWIHCASLGEFEQGRPLIERIKQSTHDSFILVSFYSPSGYEIRKDYAYADQVCYLPPDLSTSIRSFLSIVQPDLAIFVKYEFWFGYLRELEHRQISTLLIAGLFREDQLFFKPYGRWFRERLNAFDHFFVQNQSSAALLNQIDIHNVTISGDPRIDRVIQMATQATPVDTLLPYFNGKPVIVAGSTHLADMEVLAPFIHSTEGQAFQYIIAPHEVDDSHISETEALLERSVQRFSQWNPEVSTDVLIIDSIGLLAKLYQYASIAYIGGGFGKGIHSVLEPMAFQIPIIFGPNYQKFEEANWLVESGAGKSINTASELQKAVQYYSKKEKQIKAKEKISLFLKENRGSTEGIYQWMLQEIL